MEVKWKSGARFKSDPEKAYEEVEKLRKANDGVIEPEVLVESAKSDKSVLHVEFPWNNKIAAHEHRLTIARTILRSFVVVRDEIKTDRPQRTYEVVNAPKKPKEKPKKVYRHIDDIMADPDCRAELLGRALKELISFRNRFRDLQELSVVMRAVDSVLEDLDVNGVKIH